MKRCLLFLVTCLVPVTFVATPTTLAKTTLRFAHWGYNAGIDRAIKMWNKKNPKVQVVAELIDWNSYFEKIPVSIAAGSPPDVFSMLSINGKFQEYAHKGILKNLTPYFKSEMKASDWLPSSIDSVTIQQKIAAIPAGLSNAGFLFYNINLFQQRGLALPDASWDLNDFTAAAKKLTKDTNGDGKADVFGVEPFWSVNQLYDQMISAGGKIYNDASTKMDMSSPEITRILKWQMDLYINSKVMGGSFATGKSAMFAGAPQWAIATINSVKGKFKTGLTFWPMDPITKQRRFESDSWYLSMPSNGKHTKEAWAFIKWFNTKDAHALASWETFGTSQLVPPLRAVARSEVYLKPNPEIIPETFNMNTIVDGVENYTEVPRYVNHVYEIRNAMQSVLGSLLSGKLSAEQFVSRIVQEGNILINRK